MTDRDHTADVPRRPRLVLPCRRSPAAAVQRRCRAPSRHAARRPAAEATTPGRADAADGDGPEHDHDATTTTTTRRPRPTAPTTTTEPSPADAADRRPLADGQAPPDPPALVVKIDNVGSGPPQTGLNQADIVFEEIVEGASPASPPCSTPGTPNPVGPIRSGRTQDVDLLGGLNQPLFAWSGGNPGVTAPSASRVPRSTALTHGPPGFFRTGPAAAPHNLYNNTDALWEPGVAEAGRPTPLFAYVDRRAGAAAAGPPSWTRCRSAQPGAVGLGPGPAAVPALPGRRAHDAHRRAGDRGQRRRPRHRLPAERRRRAQPGGGHRRRGEAFVMSDGRLDRRDVGTGKTDPSTWTTPEATR